MALPRLTNAELEIMETLWQRGACSVREIHESFPEPKRPAFTTVQTTLYRLEQKKAVRISKRISNANIFEAAISRHQARGRLIDELLGLFGGAPGPVMAHLVGTGKLTLDDIRDAEKTLRAFLAGEKAKENAKDKKK